MTDTPAWVLDASAFLSYLQGEAGSEQVAAALLDRATIGAVNWAEVLSKLTDRGLSADAVAQQLSSRGLLDQALLVHPLDESLAREIARLRPLTRSAGLGLGDRACLALARRLGLPVLTADRAWGKLKLGVRVQVIR